MSTLWLCCLIMHLMINRFQLHLAAKLPQTRKNGSTKDSPKTEIWEVQKPQNCPKKYVYKYQSHGRNQRKLCLNLKIIFQKENKCERDDFWRRCCRIQLFIEKFWVLQKLKIKIEKEEDYLVCFTGTFTYDLYDIEIMEDWEIFAQFCVLRIV